MYVPLYCTYSKFIIPISLVWEREGRDSLIHSLVVHSTAYGMLSKVLFSSFASAIHFGSYLYLLKFMELMQQCGIKQSVSAKSAPKSPSIIIIIIIIDLSLFASCAQLIITLFPNWFKTDFLRQDCSSHMDGLVIIISSPKNDSTFKSAHSLPHANFTVFHYNVIYKTLQCFTICIIVSVCAFFLRGSLPPFYGLHCHSTRRPACCRSSIARFRMPVERTLGTCSPWWRRPRPRGRTAWWCSPGRCRARSGSSSRSPGSPWKEKKE